MDEDSPPNDPVLPRPPRARIEPTDAHVALTAAIDMAERVANQAAAMRLQLVLAQFDRAVLDEEAAGRAVHAGGAMDRAFTMHVATVLHLSRAAAGTMLNLGLMLRDDLPATMGAFSEGRCSQAQALLVAEQVPGLDAEQTARLDAAAAELVGTVAPPALQRALESLRARLDPAAAIEDAKIAAGTRTVTARPCGKGMGRLTIRTTSLVIAGLFDAIHQAGVAAHGQAGETRSYQALMADAASESILKGLAFGVTGDPAVPNELLGTPERPGTGRIQAQVTVIVPAATAVGLSDEPAELAGMGALDAEQARHVIAVSRTWTRAEVDPISSAILAFDEHDRYIPTALRKLVATRQPVCACGCNRATRRTDLDHVIRVEHDGRTRHTNLQGLCRTTHAWLKDGRYVDVRLMPDGAIRWRDQWGGIRYERPLFHVAETTQNPTAAEEACPF